MHYFKVVLRNLERQKMLTLINISGLSIGLACFSLFLLYALHEFSYDRFHANGENIYRVFAWWKSDGHEGSEPASTTPLGPAMKNDLADVEDFVRVQGGGKMLVRQSGETQNISVTFADPQILSVFTFPLLSGDPQKALVDPHNVVLSRSTALQLFGHMDVIGEPFEIKTEKGFETFVVSGVAEDVPSNSSIRFGVLASFNYILGTEMGIASLDNWNMTIGITVYVKLRSNSQLMNEPQRLASFRDKYFKDEAPNKKGKSSEKITTLSGYGLQPIADMHTGVDVDKWGATNPRNIWILLGIAASVMLIACINFIILAIGRSAGRSREVGVRKVIGSSRRKLIVQFLSESLVLTLVSAVMGFGLAQTLLPFFNEMAARDLSFSFRQYPELGLWLAGLIVVAGLLAGSYPAFVLSSFRPVEALKNTIRVAGSNFFTRSLVTFQFAISMGLIVAMSVISEQLSFMSSMDLGFDKENVVMISAGDADRTKTFPLFRHELQARTGILGVTASVMGLGAHEGQMGRGYDFNGTKQGVIEYPVDEHFLDVMGMQLIAGRNFDASITSDTVSSIIVNESLVRTALGTTPDKALGMEIWDARRTYSKTVIGVTKDFNFEPLTRTVRPQLYLYPAKFEPGSYFVRLKPGDPTEALRQIEGAWKKVAPDVPFRYHFVDDKFDAFYSSEKRWSRIVGWAGNISIFLACLGLFGLTSLAVVNRIKEIGIRKVLGATTVNIVMHLGGSFTKLVVVAILISSPLAWYAMNQWLEAFAYRVDVGWEIFFVSAAIVIAISFVTMSIQTLKAAWVSPAHSLKNE